MGIAGDVTMSRFYSDGIESKALTMLGKHAATGALSFCRSSLPNIQQQL